MTTSRRPVRRHRAILLVAARLAVHHGALLAHLGQQLELCSRHERQDRRIPPHPGRRDPVPAVEHGCGIVSIPDGPRPEQQVQRGFGRAAWRDRAGGIAQGAIPVHRAVVVAAVKQSNASRVCAKEFPALRAA